MNCPTCADYIPDYSLAHSCGWKKPIDARQEHRGDDRCSWTTNGNRCGVRATIFESTMGDKSGGKCTWHAMAHRVDPSVRRQAFEEWLVHMAKNYPGQDFWAPGNQRALEKMIAGEA